MNPRIQKQRTELILSQPFYGALALRLDIVEDPSCETFWTDSVSLGYNPAYVTTISDLEIRGALAHEVMHAANGHCWRMGERDPEGWNEAADYAINPIVLGAGFHLPGGVLNDPKYAGRAAEEIYAMLSRNDKRSRGKSKPTCDPQGLSPSAEPRPEQDDHPFRCGEVRPYTGKNVEQQEAQWKVAVIQAAKAAKMRGSFPGALEAMVHDAVAPCVDWRALLHRFAQQSSATDYSWSQPNRRYLHLGLYLPALNEPAMGDAVFVRDSSGSVFDETQAQFDAEILAVNEAMRPARLIVMDCDMRVRQIQVFERGEAVELKPIRGGGGTAFVDPFERIEEEGIRPAFLVYLTDLDGRLPEHPPSYPVLWACVVPIKRLSTLPEFGEMVEVLV